MIFHGIWGMYVDQIAIAITVGYLCLMAKIFQQYFPLSIFAWITTVFFFLGEKKWVEGAISVAFLLGHDHNSILPVLRRDPILSICEKLAYYSFGSFGMEMEYKEY